MEIFIRNVEFFTHQHEVIRALADHLHQPPYTTNMPLNFHVRMFRPKRGERKQHSGCGALTLPTTEVGTIFLNEYGEQSPRKFVAIRGRRIIFKISNKPLSLDILLSIQNSPYLDPEVLEERERIARHLKESTVPITRLQFVWPCRDQVLSAEWEHVCAPQSFVQFNANDRRLQIMLSPPDASRLRFPLDFEALLQSLQVISIDFSAIDYIARDNQRDGVPAIVLFLFTPPQFLKRNNIYDETIYRREALDITDTDGRPHSDIAPYLSYTIRLLCRVPEDLTVFESLAREAGLNLPIHSDYWPVDRRQLFSVPTLHSFSSWLQELDFPVAFQIERLVLDFCVDPKEMLELRNKVSRLVVDSRKRGSPTQSVDYVITCLRDFGSKAYDMLWYTGQEETLGQCFLDSKRRHDHTFKPLTRREDDGIFLCMHVQITPTGMIYTGPLPERSNRVIRQYSPENHQNFLRVSFHDEGRLQLQFERGVDGKSFVRRRIGPFFQHGLQVAGRKFTFLGYSQSALKEHAVYFMAPFFENGQEVTTATVIESLGQFSDLPFDLRLMYCPARYAARISQGFTSTDPTLTEVDNVITDLPDIKSVDSQGNQWCHTDGVGTMSPEFAKSVHADRQSQRRGRRRPLEEYARALQIRMMGSKGMLSVDERLTGKTVCLRQSMIKFIGTPSRKLEVAKVFDKPGILYLNRPLIMLLEGLGVPYSSFKKFQDIAVREAEESTESFDRASSFLQSHGLGTSFRIPSVLLSLSKLGITEMDDDGFYDKLMEYGVNHVLRLLKHRARIPVPKAWNLVGVADIRQYLPPKHIFACVKPVDHPKIYLEGQVLISRSPTIHPGDVQIVTAIGRPPRGSYFEQNDLANTVVFSTTDERPLPSCLGGGDLDGDEYNVIPLNVLPEFQIDSNRIQTPGSYPAAKRRELDRPCTMDDVGEFVMEYITSDVLGIVSINWRILADQTDIFNQDCMKMAELHSLAVDYPKSGNPVPIQQIPKRTNLLLPDWYAPETMYELDLTKFYPSQKAIGKLFRAIKLEAPQQAFQEDRGRRALRRERREEDVDDFVGELEDTRLHDDNGDDHLYDAVFDRVAEFVDNVDEEIDEGSWDDVRNLFQGYRSELEAICSTHTLSKRRGAMLTEEEATVGTIVANTSQPRKRLEHIGKLREQADTLVRSVRDSLEGGDDLSPGESLRQAFIAWRFARSLCSRRKPPFGAKSFWWVTLGAVFEGVKEVEQELMYQRRRDARRARAY
ncbi:RdRP-domain-containing protein [Marasmius fiardii PR-910]|nr:RdRP-domain-containing protein [Marasmius fiardii PR-910]